MIPSKVMAKMATLGFSEEQAIAVASMLTEVEEATASQAEAVAEVSRSKARARVQKWRDTHKSNVTERNTTLQGVTERLTGERVPVEDITSNLEIEVSKQESKKVARATRLSADWVLPDEWREDGRNASLSEAQIDAEWVTMRDWSLSAPKGAKHDWRAAWRTWCRRVAGDAQKVRAGPRGARAAPMDHFRNFASEIDEQNRDNRSIGSNWDDAPGIPVRAIEHHG